MHLVVVVGLVPDLYLGSIFSRNDSLVLSIVMVSVVSNIFVCRSLLMNENFVKLVSAVFTVIEGIQGTVSKVMFLFFF